MYAVWVLLACVHISRAAAPQFSSAQKVGTVGAHDVDEASGLAASRQHAGVLYTQNDKGDSSRIFAIAAASGKLLATMKIAHIANYDWEDLAVGPCPGSGSCIYIAETGDHAGDGAKNIIYRVKEPAVIKDQTLDVLDQLHFRWGEPDCECVMVDPAGNTYVVSKVHGGRGLIAKLPSYGWGGTTVDAGPSQRVPITSTHNDPNGCDISPDGKEMLIKARDAVYYWAVPNGDYVSAVKTAPATLPYHPEPRGESVAWTPNGDGYYTLSEGDDQPLYFYKRL
ncbi:uncharacterized protein LOC124283913 [Haliotis rubra]|uniref:uncharacterized protein LOC124283913 n=1 Tax=Haliotis rubra TaxID=36100 RepID=UPI001EE60559|nr:uncharacterized protein LOC124283913 [Haliotis rubra]